MIVLSVFLAVALAAFAETEYQSKFVSWMQEHQKSYAHEEFQSKYAVFKANVDFIEAHNGDASQTHRVALNEFADLTAAQFAKIYNGVKYVHSEKQIALAPELAINPNSLPVSVDWRAKGAVTAIKNQGQCGSCWSFSTTGSVEGQHFIKKQASPSGKPALVGLSEQNLMDCSGSYGNDACDGGLMDQAFQYIIANKGIELESDYPYTAVDGNSCKYKSKDRGACIQGYVDVPQNDEVALHAAIAAVGPVSVAIDASHSSFQFYSSGVYNEPACSSTQLDHGVLAVGYGKEPAGSGGHFYWVKNSWGTTWGINGFIKMSAYKKNQCGIATSASYPTISSLKC